MGLTRKPNLTITTSRSNVENLFNDIDAFCKTPIFSTYGQSTARKCTKCWSFDECRCMLPSLPVPFAENATVELPPFSNHFVQDAHSDAHELVFQHSQYKKVQSPVHIRPSHSLRVQVPSSLVQQHSSPTTPESNHSTPVQLAVFVKPARKPKKQFLTYFPSKLYCSPYKYDIRIRVHNGVLDDDLLFTLLDGETREPYNSNSKNEPSLLVDKCKNHQRQSSSSRRNAHIEEEEEEEDDNDETSDHASDVFYRLCFTVCSFHNHKRPFIIQCTMQDGTCVFESNSFHIFARKANKDKTDVWGNEGDAPLPTIKIMFPVTQASSAPVNHDVAQQGMEQPKRKRRESSLEPKAKRQRPSVASPGDLVLQELESLASKE